MINGAGDISRPHTARQVTLLHSSLTAHLEFSTSHEIVAFLPLSLSHSAAEWEIYDKDSWSSGKVRLDTGILHIRF